MNSDKTLCVKIKDLEIEHVYYDDDPPQVWLEEDPWRPITDEDIKDFFSGWKKIWSWICVIRQTRHSEANKKSNGLVTIPSFADAWIE